MTSIAITGASGNVGTGVLRRLRADGQEHQVVGICRRPPAPVAPYDQATWHTIDVSSSLAVAKLTEVFRTVDVVVHLAWAIQPVSDAAYLHRVNVDGSQAVLEAARAAEVAHLVYASSLGVYAPAPTSRVAVDEQWPSRGIATSVYSRDKTEVERILETFERENPRITVTRLRPPLVAQREAAGVLRRYFLGFLGSRPLLAGLEHGLLPTVPLPAGLSLQFVHADDFGDGVVRAIQRREPGVFNMAADPLSGEGLAALLGTRHVAIPASRLRTLVVLMWRLRGLPLSPGWFDIAINAPTLTSERAHKTLAWTPRWTSEECVEQIVTGLHDRSASPSPVLRG